MSLTVNIVRVFGAVFLLNMLFCFALSAKQEDECRNVAGVCMSYDECPANRKAPEGLCPFQSEEGIECCYDSTIEQRTCTDQGGECTDHCLVFGTIPKEHLNEGSCGPNEICCLHE